MRIIVLILGIIVLAAAVSAYVYFTAQQQNLQNSVQQWITYAGFGNNPVPYNAGSWCNYLTVTIPAGDQVAQALQATISSNIGNYCQQLNTINAFSGKQKKIVAKSPLLRSLLVNA